MHRLDVRAKGQNDFVTEIDTQAELEIIEIVRKHYPDHAVLGEESGQTGGPAEASSCGSSTRSTARPTSCTAFRSSPCLSACNGAAAWSTASCTTRCVRSCSPPRAATARSSTASASASAVTSGLDRALIGTGFPYRANLQWLDNYMAMMKVVTQATAGIRRPGAAALDLAYVAAGRLDAFWEFGLSPWDTAAGMLLITEAGGLVGTLTGGEYKHQGHILAGSPKVYAALLEVLAPHVPESLRS